MEQCEAEAARLRAILGVERVRVTPVKRRP
jgi:hypothetical protein